MSWRAVFTYLPFCFALVAWGAYVGAARYRQRAQAVSLMVVLFAAAKFLAFAAFGGDAFRPQLPAAVIWGWNWLYTSMFMLLVLAVLWLLGRLVTRSRGRERGSRIARIALPVLALVFAGWGVANGLVAPRVVEYVLVYPDLPEELDGYRIAHLSDLHISSAAGEWRTRETVARTNALKPDLICLTGDLVDGEVGRLAAAAAPLGELKAKDGVFAVAGNHEFYGPWAEWREFFARRGVRWLENECVFPRATLALGGVPDPAICRLDAFSSPPDIRRTFAPAASGEFRLLLEHRPAMARERSAAGVRLQLSGHTHGGIMPLVDRAVAAFNGGFVSGVYPLTGGPRPSRLVVSRGTGQWAGFPVRFFNPSEITLIILRRQ